jgi:hypothetical protein
MPDLAPTLHDDPRYTIRFANENTWEASSGTNVITNDLRISKSAPGAENKNYLKFEEIIPRDEIR